jgi:hypothetical protein
MNANSSVMSINELRRRNAATPFGRLPPELIIQILAYAVASGHSDKSQIPKYDARWSRAMLICAYIRAIALSTPALWTLIDCRWSLPWIDLCLERARNKSITLSAEAKAPIRVLGGLLHKCRGLAIEANSLQTEDCPQRRLEALLCADGDPSNIESFQFYGSSSSPVHITPLFLGGVCDSLRSLVLHGVDVQETPSFPALRHLELKWVHTDRTCLSLLRMLERAPLLETLSIAHVYIRDAQPFTALHQNETGQPCPDLHLLRTLRVCSTLTGVSVLLRILQSLPNPSDELSITVENYDNLSALDASFKQRIEEVYTRIAQFWYRKTSSSLAQFSELHTSLSKTKSRAQTLQLICRAAAAQNDSTADVTFAAQLVPSCSILPSFDIATICTRSWSHPVPS